MKRKKLILSILKAKSRIQKNYEKIKKEEKISNWEMVSQFSVYV